MTDNILSAIIGAISGSVVTGVGAYIAPWVNWGIEKRRDRMNRRRDLINNARIFLTADHLTREHLRQAPGLSAIRSYLPPNIISDMQSHATGGEITLKEQILAEIAKLEKEWKLI